MSERMDVAELLELKSYAGSLRHRMIVNALALENFRNEIKKGMPYRLLEKTALGLLERTRRIIMKQDTGNKGLWIGVLIAALLIIGLLLTGCGSGGGTLPGPGLSGEGVAITCMDASTDQQAACRGLQEGISKPGREALAVLDIQTVIYNAGDIQTGTTIWAQAEVTNFMAVNAPVYFYTEFNEGGVFSGSTAQTYREEIKPGQTIEAQYGSNACPDPGSCAHEGYWEYVTYIYNASHLILNTSQHGDPATDEVLFKGILKFNLRSDL